MKPQRSVCLPHGRHVSLSHIILPLGVALGKLRGGFQANSVPPSSALIDVIPYLSGLHRWINSERKGNSEWYYCDLDTTLYSNWLCRCKEGRKRTLNVFWKTEESSAGKWLKTLLALNTFVLHVIEVFAGVNVTVVCVRIKDIKETWVFSYIKDVALF